MNRAGLEILPPGSNVLIQPDLSGRILGILIREACHISYEVAWFFQGVRYTSWLALSHQELREQYEIFCKMSDAEFTERLADAAHLACIIGYLKEIGIEATIGDAGIVHELIHLMVEADPLAQAYQLSKVREQFKAILMLA